MTFQPPPPPPGVNDDGASEDPQQSRRRRIVTWTLASLGIAALTIVAVTAVVSLIASSIPSAAPLPAVSPTASLPRGVPTPQPTQTGTGAKPDFDPPAYSTAVNGVYPLDSYAYFPHDVDVTYDLPSNWYSAHDKFGEYWLSDDPVCNLTAMPKWIYIWGDPEPGKSDGYYTKRDLDLSEANLRAQFPDLTDHGDDIVVDMPVSDGNVIEFAGRRLDYSGGFFLQLTRGMVWQDSSYGITLSCLGGDTFDHEALAQRILDRFTMVLK
ncbi:hypothetical protein SAMN04489806_0580 [Paramicrobacterium humi]|uniref:Uncharacterized protein n=1 Tax=Paramicrobacterium humi TaxID=640635 RepID=A0A1H4JAC3_9MICO|nr:hypothetical protein [Microbacterium humi]SEB43005.1 hypothetical protein SAMN04489806_0580 [Microbacterium humi]